MAAVRIAVLLPVMGVAIFNLVHRAETLSPAPVDPTSAAMDHVMKQEKRFGDLRRSLERRGLSGAIGYMGNSTAEDPHSTEDYYLAQFALVPWVLDRHLESCEWVVANLGSSAAISNLPPSWQVAEDFGDGLLLLKRSAP